MVDERDVLFRFRGDPAIVKVIFGPDRDKLNLVIGNGNYGELVEARTWLLRQNRDVDFSAGPC